MEMQAMYGDEDYGDEGEMDGYGEEQMMEDDDGH